MALPTPGNQVVVTRNESRFQTCVLTNKRFPPLSKPRAIQDRITPDNLAELEGWLEHRLHAGRSGMKTEYAFQARGVKKVHIAYDRDEAGEKAAESLAQELLAM